MTDRWRRSAFDEEEAEPLGPLANLVDIMLVFACGLIAALVAVSPDLKQHFTMHTQLQPGQNDQITDLINASQKTEAVQSGKELTDIPAALKQQLQQPEGYESLGQVYRDPQSGKLILVK